jgi:hypothetical protein
MTPAPFPATLLSTHGPSHSCQDARLLEEVQDGSQTLAEAV